MYDYFYLEFQKSAAPLISKAKVRELVISSIPALKKQFNGGEKFEYLTLEILIKAFNEFKDNFYIEWNGNSYRFNEFKTLCKSKVPTLERLLELDLWNELSPVEQQRLMSFFEERPLFQKKAIGNLFKRSPFRC